MGTYQPVYEDDSVRLIWDQTSPLAVLAGAAISATTMSYIAGAMSWTVQLPDAVTGVAGGKVGTLLVQVNNSNPIMRADVSAIKWTVNPLLNQPSMGNRNDLSWNSAFTGNWSTVGTVGQANGSITSFNIPARFVRLFGVGVTGLTNSNSAAFIWSSGMAKGN